jgi:hypothetical protein
MAFSCLTPATSTLLLLLLQYDLEAQRVGFADMDCHALGQMPPSKVIDYVNHNSFERTEDKLGI